MNDTRKQQRPPKQQRPLGTAREEVLALLAHHGGTWTKDSRWKWSGNAHWTEELLCSLASRGLVDETQPGTFRLNEAGAQRAQRIQKLSW